MATQPDAPPVVLPACLCLEPKCVVSLCVIPCRSVPPCALCLVRPQCPIPHLPSNNLAHFPTDNERL